MDLSSILDVTTRLCGCIRNTTYHIRHLEDNLNSLRNEMGTLKRQRDDVKREVETAERQPMRRRTERVDGWLQKIEQLEREVEELLQQGEEEIQKKCLKICPRNCRSSHKLGKKVTEKLQAVSDMKSEGDFSTVAVTLPWENAQEIPLDRTLGLDSNFNKVLSLLRDDGVGLIGIYGMVGAGKTTLLKKLNNELANQSSGEFDEVIWVVVSKDSVEAIQDKIGKKLQFPDDMWSRKSQDEKQADIFGVLKTKKFVLLLDDIWESLDLLEVGVPLPNNQNKAKVVFTTRSEEVCGLMKAKKIKVDCLAWEEAWDLFKDKVGEETLNSDPEIPKLAEDVCKECAGLPLTLVTIGRAMASKRTPQEWHYATSVLNKSASKFPGMEDKVLCRLKFSYDSLPDETTRICFLYCCLYPEDWDIPVRDLIKFWIGEGFLNDECDNIDEAYTLAYEIIGRLKLACLLLESKELDCLNMHDVIRNMAIWIVSESGRMKEKYLLQGNLNLTVAPPISKWEKAERVFLQCNSILELSGAPMCSNLSTLILSGNALTTISTSFFQFMQTLKVLDLSGNMKLTTLPPSLFGLSLLQHLDLSSTGIRELPIKFKSLVSLKYLYLNNIYELDIIPLQVISSLSMLQKLEMCGSGVPYHGINEGSIFFDGSELFLDELERLNHLQYLSLTVKTKLALQKLLASHKLRSCTFRLGIELCEGLSQIHLSSLQKNIKRLESLFIIGCDDLEELSMDWMSWEERERAVPQIDGSRSFHNLQKITIGRCNLLKDLTWLICVPNLQTLHLVHCDAMEELIKDVGCGTEIATSSREGGSSVFSRLQKLFIFRLPNLKSIYSHPLRFPSLIQIRVANCPKLNKLPFDSDSGKDTLQLIRGEREWWNKLEWESEETLSHFSSLFEKSMAK